MMLMLEHFQHDCFVHAYNTLQPKNRMTNIRHATDTCSRVAFDTSLGFICDFVIVDEHMKCAKEIESLYRTGHIRCSEKCLPTCRYVQGGWVGGCVRAWVGE